MEFDDAKENIQPLACGRNASILHASITHTSRELNEQRRELEATIQAYSGDDPLEPWYNYICWIEQMFPSGGKESGLTQVLSKCLRRFESEERYYQDRRMIKLFIKFLYGNNDPLECFQQLFNGGIGTMVADFYIAWAYCYDSIGQMQKAEEIFRRGIECRAEPLDELKEAHQHFKLAICDRVLYKDNNDALQNTNRQLEERRLALSSLRSYRKRKGEVGSIRTGVAIKSYNPGTVQSDVAAAGTSTNARVAILKDENMDPNAVAEPRELAAITATESEEQTKSSGVIRSIVDTVRHQENEHEPGPWNKVHDKKNAKKLMRQKKVVHEIGFSIHEDMDIVEEDEEQEDDITLTVQSKMPKFKEIILPATDKRYEQPFKYPANFVTKNRPQAEWILPVTTEIEPDANTIPRYNKCMIYPRPNREFQMEEYYAYCYYKKKRGIENEFTRRYDSVWSINNINVPFRMYPNFARKSQPQKLDALDVFEANPHIEGLHAPTLQMYDVTAKEEFQLEELMARDWLKSQNLTVMEPQDMEETICASSNSEQVKRRKSFFPLRRSLAIRKMITEAVNESVQNDNIYPHVEKNLNENQVNIEATTAGTTATTATVQKHNEETAAKLTNRITFADKENAAVPETTTATNPVNEKNEFHFKLPALPVKSLKIQNENSETVSANAPTSLLPQPPPTAPHAANKLALEIFVEDETTAGNAAATATMQKHNEETAAKLTNCITFADKENAAMPETTATNSVNEKNEFHFKLPALPVKSLTIQNENSETVSANALTSLLPQPPPAAPHAANKLAFEIFVEDETTADVGVGAGATNAQSVFDAEETCSTQLFNICLKSQSASTPKLEQKTQKRQFANVLREVEQPKPNSPAATLSTTSSSGTSTASGSSTSSPSKLSALVVPSFSPGSPDNEAAGGGGITSNSNSFSPRMRKQLSTILETSEHGTQSTATTVTKSSNGTQMSDISEATTAAYQQTQKTQIEITENTHATQEVTTLMAEVQIADDVAKMNNCSVVATTVKSPAPPVAATNFQSISQKTGAINAGVVDLTFGEATQLETEDEVIQNCRQNQPPTNLKFDIFQDPTETVPKIMLANVAVNAVAGKFDRMPLNDDSTIVQPIAVQNVRYQQDQTETLTKFVGGRFYPDDKTETFTGNFLAKPQPIMSTKKNKSPFSEDEYDTLDFFRKSPIKFPTVSSFANREHNRSNVQLTPLNDAAAKKICMQETPTAAASTYRNNFAKATHTTKPTTNFVNTNKNLLDTFMNDFSLPTNSSSTTKTSNKPTTNSRSEAKLRDSFVPEFSFIEDTQPIANNEVNNKSYIKSPTGNTEASVIEETQPVAEKKSETRKPCIGNTEMHNAISFVIEETQETAPPLAPAASKGAIPKVFSLNKSKLDESLLMAPKDSSVKKNLTQKQSIESFAQQRSTMLNQTANRSVSILQTDSFLMDVSTTATTTNKNSQPIFVETQMIPTATPKVDKLLESFNKTKTFDLSQKVESAAAARFKQPNFLGRESLIPRFVSSAKKTQAQNEVENENQTKINTQHEKSNQSYSLLTPNKPPQAMIQWPQNVNNKNNNLGVFQLNGDGDTFANGINLINSTMLSNERQSYNFVRQSMIQEPSLHIKTEAESNAALTSNFENFTTPNNSRSLSNFQSEQQQQQQEDEMSIFYKNTPRTPKLSEHLSWSCDDANDVEFVPHKVDLNETAQIIEKKFIDTHINPFDPDLINAFLDNLDFISFLKNTPNTMLVGSVSRLQQNLNLTINDASYKITKLIGHGSYGAVYCGIDTKTSQKYAFKQERPPKYWEYYICLEVQDRIHNDKMLSSYMNIDHAKIGNNASIFVSAFSPYGSIITVCNKIKKVTSKNVDEYVVMHLTCELLEMIDHLHAAEIIHADLKADNILFMKKLSYNSKRTSLHLIDFGESIDMRQFKPRQVFSYICNDDAFKCIEMREQRPWTYQLDLYGLAGVIHVLLFGTYMQVEKKKIVWMPKQHMPRYINKQLWENIFRTLLNIRDCFSMPNLQELRQMLKEEMAEKERFVINKIAEFNKALDA